MASEWETRMGSSASGRRRRGWMVLVVLFAGVGFLPVVARGAPPATAGEFDIEDYLVRDDIAAAAANMRADALAVGLDTSLVPVWRSIRAFADTASGELQVSPNGFRRMTIDMRNDSLARRFTDAKASGIAGAVWTVVMVTVRNLSIDETATILEGRVRILDSPACNIFVVRGKEADLGMLVERDYFGWIAEIAPESKHDPNWSESPSGEYDIFVFGSVTAEYTRELESRGLMVESSWSHLNGVTIRGAWDRVRILPSLWWVRFVMGNHVSAAPAD